MVSTENSDRDQVPTLGNSNTFQKMFLGSIIKLFNNLLASIAVQKQEERD
jgi:hypothetical protein